MEVPYIMHLLKPKPCDILWKMKKKRGGGLAFSIVVPKLGFKFLVPTWSSMGSYKWSLKSPNIRV